MSQTGLRRYFTFHIKNFPFPWLLVLLANHGLFETLVYFSTDLTAFISHVVVYFRNLSWFESPVHCSITHVVLYCHS